jgi:hypothetical protein
MVKGGTQGTSITEVVLGNNPGNVTINYDMKSIPDQMDVYYGGVLVRSTNQLVSNRGSLNWDYPADEDLGYTCVIVVRAPWEGTVWDYSVSCPK